MMTVLEQRFMELVPKELHELNQNLKDINETLKVIAVQINEKGGNQDGK